VLPGVRQGAVGKFSIVPGQNRGRPLIAGRSIEVNVVYRYAQESYMNNIYAKTAAGAALAVLISLAYTAPARAQAIAPPLGTAGNYTVLGTNGIPTSGTVTCTTSTIDGNVGSSGNSITDTGPCTITGDIDAPVAAGVISDFDDAYDAVGILNPVCDGLVPTTTTTLPPGVYCSTAGTTIGAGVTITLDGDASDVWVFRVGTGGLGALTGTGPGLEVVMGGTANACNVYWWTAEGATMTDAVFAGNVLSGAAATMTDTNWQGRALAATDVASTDSIISGCPAVPPPTTVHQIPTLGLGAIAALMALLAGMGLVAFRRFPA